MNRKLLDPFEPEYPEAIEACLDDEYAVKCAYSHNGSLLATARSDGYCYIWDMDTLNVMRKLEHGEASLSGLSWSRSGRYILTYDEVGLCILWDLKTVSIAARVEFESAISSARVHPRNSHQFIVCPTREAPCLVTVSSTPQTEPTISPICISAEGVDQKSKAAAATCCCFAKKGIYAFFGTSKGQIYAVHVGTRAVVCSTKLSSSGVNTISRNPRGTDIVTNSSDRILRVCQVVLPEDQQDSTLARPEPSIVVTTKIQDIVNRVHWIQAVFSASGDYIVSGIEHKAEHNMYIWDKFSGSLVKMLTGPNELLEDFAVHPLRPVYASISTFGIIYLWTRVPQQNWNAFAPGFRELEENVDFIEPEDQFDRRVAMPDGVVVDCAEDRILREKRAANAAVEGDMDADVDITDNDPLFSDSDSETEDGDFLLPVVVDCDEDLLPPALAPTCESVAKIAAAASGNAAATEEGVAGPLGETILESA
ncbi:chromatin binding protein [Coemansia interrupta]|uniref:Chromatin binding protein n=1 Tax=Coemansia interrupta TaxID=1126814 RepID=A0A9W8HQR7_9FUNG|nr:chromatin binding protein [Coemansia interrupta]